MKWYHYAACFFAGLFLVNTIPHFIHGISGEFFPTPFANPPGKGLSAPIVNVLWGLGNLAAGSILFKLGKVSRSDKWGIGLFCIAIVLMSIMLSMGFSQK